MKTSESIINIVKALVAAQKSIKHAVKDAKNPHFKNDYATLESVIDASKMYLLDQGIVVIQAINDKSLVTRLFHTSGEYIESSFELLVDKSNMQGLGSAVTYARRYSLASMLNIAQADDDANQATQQPQSGYVPNTKAAIEGAKTEAKQTINADNVGDYIMSFGQANVKGKKLKDIDPAVLKSAVAWAIKENKNEGHIKVSTHNIGIFLKNAENQPPTLSSSDEVPF